MQTADNDNAESDICTVISTKPLSPAAQRALQEAEDRRKAADEANNPPKEYGGRGGADPARFGDWEINGRAIDF